MIEISVDYMYRSAQLKPTIKIISRLWHVFFDGEQRKCHMKLGPSADHVNQLEN